MHMMAMYFQTKGEITNVKYGIFLWVILLNIHNYSEQERISMNKAWRKEGKKPSHLFHKIEANFKLNINYNW